MTTFPTAKDTFTNPGATDLLSAGATPHHAQHANANDAILALETKVGITGSTDATSLDYKVANRFGVSGVFYAAESGTPKPSRVRSSGASTLVATGEYGCSGTLRLYQIPGASYLANCASSAALTAYLATLAPDLTMAIASGTETTGTLAKVAGRYLVGVLAATGGQCELGEAVA